MNMIKDVKVISGEEVAQQHQLLVCDLLVRAVKEVRKPFIPKRKVWRLKEDEIRQKFVRTFRVKPQRKGQDASIEDLWDSLKDDLLATSDAVCGWTKGPPRHRVTWWCNDFVDEAVKEKHRLWKAWKKGSSKEEYLEAKRAAKRAVYDAKKIAEEERFRDVLRREDDRAEVFKIAKQMTTSNRDVVGDKCVRND